MTSNLISIVPARGCCGLCDKNGTHAFFDRDLLELICGDCYWEVHWAEVLIRDCHAWQAPVFPPDVLDFRVRKFEHSGLRRLPLRREG